ncbi:MAG: DegV family protein [Firmicutes bacterium]|nr:DegV family protein [Bacillota bacterium]
MKIKVTTQATADLSPELLKEYNVSFLPFPISLGDKEYVDGENITPSDIYKFFDETGLLPKTAAPNPTVIREFFEENLKGYDAIIHISISNELSMVLANAKMAAEGLPVYIVDSRSLSTGIGLQVLYACDLAKQGLKPEEIQQKVQDRALSVQASFICGNLKFLYEGGRCSAAKAFMAHVLGIRPLIELNDGRMGAGKKKFRGKMKIVLKEYVDHILENFNNYDKKRVFVTYTQMDQELVDMVVDMVKGKFDKVYAYEAGCTITSHCGKGTLGVLYFNSKE